jgi:hypothetical protein
MDNKILKKIDERLSRLEEAIFARGPKSRSKLDQSGHSKPSHFKGATGGVRLLISKNFFGQKKPLAGVRAALAENGYHYSLQAVDVALRRQASRTGPLTVLKEHGKNFYVNRK